MVCQDEQHGKHAKAVDQQGQVAVRKHCTIRDQNWVWRLLTPRELSQRQEKSGIRRLDGCPNGDGARADAPQIKESVATLVFWVAEIPDQALIDRRQSM